MRSLVVLVAIAGVASAQSPEVMREFQAGVDAYRLGKLDEARARLEKVRALDPKLAGPNRFLAAVAHAQGRWQDCIDAARLALALNPRSAEIADTRRLHEECRRSSGRPSYRSELGEGAAIAVTSDVTGATVKVDALTYGGTPLEPRPIPVGTHVIEVEKTGWKSVRLEVEVLPGIVTDVAVELEPDPAAKSDGAPTVDPRGIANGWVALPGGTTGEVWIDGSVRTPNADGRYEVAPGDHVVEIRQPGRDPWRGRLRIKPNQKTIARPVFVETAPREAKQRIGMILVGSGGAIAALGFTSYLLASRASAEAREIDRVETGRPPNMPIDESIEPLRTRADFEDARSRAKRWGLISNLAYTAALATVGTGAYFLFRGARADRDLAPIAITPVGGGAMVSTELAW